MRETIQAGEICDFCNSPEPIWIYPCESFDAPDLPNARSLEDWLACERCHGLIERGDWRALAELTLVDKPNEFRADALRFLLELHQGFQANRTGPPRPAVTA